MVAIKNIFLKFILILTVLFGGLTANIVHAEAFSLVQISDETFNDFYHNLQVHNVAKKVNLYFEQVNKQALTGKNYDSYMIMSTLNNELKTAEASAIITVYVNKAGIVSKITITGFMDKPKTKLAAYETEYVVLGALGIPDAMDKEFMSDILAMKLPFQIAIWNNWTKRNIVVSHDTSPTTDELLYIRLTAIDEKV